MKAINVNNVVTAEVKPPYENSKEEWDYCPSHGWQVLYTLTGLYPEKGITPDDWYNETFKQQ